MNPEQFILSLDALVDIHMSVRILAVHLIEAILASLELLGVVKGLPVTAALDCSDYCSIFFIAHRLSVVLSHH